MMKIKLSISCIKNGNNANEIFYIFITEEECKIQYKGDSPDPKGNNTTKLEECIFERKYGTNGTLKKKLDVLVFHAHQAIDIIKESKCSLGNDLYGKALESLLFLVEEISFKSLTKPYLVEELTYKAWRYSDKKLFRNYLDLCMDNNRAGWFQEAEKFKRDETGDYLPGANREREILEIVFENVDKDCRTVRKIIKDDPSVHEKIRRWFLACYDLQHLKQFEKEVRRNNITDFPLCQLPNKIKTIKFKQTLFFLSDLNFYILTLLFLLLASILAWGGYYSPARAEAALFPVHRLIAIVSLALFAVTLILKTLNEVSSLLRLMGCILAGYFAVYSDEAWTGVIYLSQYNNSTTEYILKIVMRWIIPGIFTYIYLYREIYNKVRFNLPDDDVKKAVRDKTLSFFIQTISLTLMIGIILSDFTWSGMAQSQVEKGIKIIHTPFLMGSIFPEFILSQAPLAIFIGIFLNLLWEDKALTEPL